jgi:hypothetical protein
MSIITDEIAEPQILPHEAEARQSAEAEPPYPSVDSLEDRQYHQVRLHCDVALEECWRDEPVGGSMR